MTWWDLYSFVSGNLLTILDVITGYSEAIPVRIIHANVMGKHLISHFTRYGMSKDLQSDREAKFTWNLSKQTLGLCMYCLALTILSQKVHWRHTIRHWRPCFSPFDTGVVKTFYLPMLFVMFAVREVPSGSLGFSRNELVFDHRVRNPLDVMREEWSCSGRSTAEQLLNFVTSAILRLHKALELDRDNLTLFQAKVKTRYDRKAKARPF